MNCDPSPTRFPLFNKLNKPLHPLDIMNLPIMTGGNLIHNCDKATTELRATKYHIIILKITITSFIGLNKNSKY